MKYNPKKLKKFKKIIVCGPQRSGTAILTKIIADDLNLPLIEENQIKAGNLELLKKVLKKKEYVLQGTGIFAFILDLPKDIMFVWSIREVVDILQSEFRIKWREESYEKYKILIKFHDPILSVLPVCVQKYIIWQTRIRPNIKNWTEVYYSSLSNHKLWINKKDRETFIYNQTEK